MPPPRDASSSVFARALRSLWLPAAFLFLVTLLVYAPILRAGFVWNDLDYVTRPDLRSLAGLARIWFEVGSTEQHYPLLHSFFWLEHRLWGDAPLRYHLANVLLHAAAACLLALCVRRLLAIAPASTRPGIENRKSRTQNPTAWLAALLFALHPVGVESVAWISEQKNTLSLVFYLAAALAYLDFDATRRPALWRLATGLFVLALLSKTLTATLPAALLVVLWWRRGALAWTRDVRPLLTWFVLGALFGLFSAWVEHSVLGTTGLEFNLTFLQRLLVAGRAPWFYLGKLLWPADLVFIYPRWRLDAADIDQWLFPLGLLGLLAALWFLARRRGLRGPLAALLFFTGSLFPVMGFFTLYAFRYAFVADHWQYLPSLGLHVAAAVTLVQLSATLTGRAARWLLRAAVLALVATLALLSRRELPGYADLETFYRTIIARNPTSRLAYSNLGGLLLAHLDFRGVTGRYVAISTRRPASSATAWELIPLDSDSASAASSSGPAASASTPSAPFPPNAQRIADALRFFQQALAVDPDNPEALSNLGFLLTQFGQPDAGLAFLQHALRVRPEFPEALLNLGNTLSVRDRHREAIQSLRLALRYRPGFDAAGDALGNALLRAGRLDEAIAQYEALLRSYPRYLDARVNLGNALVRADRLDEAVAAYETALRQEPDRAEAHNNLGFALLRLGRLDESLAHLRRALALWPDYQTARNNLALAEAEAQKRRP